MSISKSKLTVHICQGEGGRVLWISIVCKNQNPKNALGFQQNPQNIPRPKITPKKSHAKFLSHKIFQKGLNGDTGKKKH